MTAEALTGLLGGLTLGISYAIAGYVMSRRAQSSPERFFIWVAGGMAIRMFAALAVIAIVIAFAPVHKATFLGSFLILFVIGVIVEIVAAYRR